jgi:RluA family pseudouridine synthase
MPSGPIDVLHEDDAVVAVSKPPGETVVAARGDPPEACLRRRLEEQLGRPLWVVHRIDRDASGLVVFAANARAHRALSLAFERRQVAKTYVAFVAGSLEPDQGQIDVALHGARRGKARPARPDEPGRREAVTEYAVQARWRRDEAVIALVEARPRTGRPHQIRVHLRSVGAPVLFDPLYGRGWMPPHLDGAPCGRLALHARRLEVPASRGGGRLVLEAPLATDLGELHAWLETDWSGRIPQPRG